jgi:anti-sigma B factor antagonist
MLNPKELAEPEKVPPFELDVFVVSLEGEFDIAERVRLLDAFALTANASVVVVNFEKTHYVDSSVLECLVALERAITGRGATLRLVGLRSEIRRIFDVCGLDRIFDIRDKLSDVPEVSAVDQSRVRRLALIVEPAIGPDSDETVGSPR